MPTDEDPTPEDITEATGKAGVAQAADRALDAARDRAKAVGATVKPSLSPGGPSVSVDPRRVVSALVHGTRGSSDEAMAREVKDELVGVPSQVRANEAKLATLASHVKEIGKRLDAFRDHVGAEFLFHIARLLWEGHLRPEELMESRHFRQAVLINHERAKTVTDDAALLALARLTFVYKDRAIDRSFRALARLIEDLVPGEMEELITLTSGASAVMDSFTEIDSVSLYRCSDDSGRTEWLAGEYPGIATAGLNESSGIIEALLRFRLAQPPGTDAPFKHRRMSLLTLGREVVALLKAVALDDEDRSVGAAAGGAPPEG